MSQTKKIKSPAGKLFEASDSGKIFLDKEGGWFHEGVEITHKKTVELFSKSVIKDPAGGYRLQIGKESAKIIVEDTPYLVRMVELSQDKIIIQLNDRSTETLDPQTLWIGKHNVLYARVKKQQFPARFLRPAYYQMMNSLEQDETGFYLRIGNQRWQLK